MTAVLIPTAGEAEWLEARRQGVTASEIAVVMGLSPYGSPYELYHRKLGTLPAEIPDNDAMAIGRHMESFVADRFADRHYPEWLVAGTGRELYAHPERPWQMATPDRLVSEFYFEPVDTPDLVWETTRLLAVLECKVDDSDGWGDDGTDEIPVRYRCQVLWQMDVLGVDTGYVACLLWHRREIRVYQLTMDSQAEDDLDLMKNEADAFLACIANRIEPAVDWRPATSAALRYLHPEVEDRDVAIGRQLAISYRAACRRYREAERRKDEMTNRMLAAIGAGHRAIEACTDLDGTGGRVVASRSVYEQRRIDTMLLRALYPATAAEVTKASTVHKLNPAREPSA